MTATLSRRIISLLIPALCGGGGCGGGGGGRMDAGIDGGIGDVELGTGVDDFTPLTGDQLELVTGPQGGHHFIVHARISGFLPGDPSMPGSVENPATTFAAFRDADDLQIDLMFPSYRLGYEETSDGTFDLGSGLILQLQEDLVEAVIGEPVTITVSVVDSAGTHGEDSFAGTVVAAPPM